MNSLIESPHKGLIIFTVMMIAILEVLDSTIVNVALPTMMPALSANQNQITWVLTAYVVASAIMVPLTGFLSARLGNQRLLLINVTGFLAGSFFSGLSTSLTQMILFRICQGACGAALIPLSQAILRQTFPINQQGKAMTIWGLGIMMAPILGPTIGGYITEMLSWRWVFYINVPICILALVLITTVIPRDKGEKIKIDYITLFALLIGVGCLQLMLDQGNEKNWFDNNSIVLLAILSAVGLLTLIIRSLRLKKPLINLWLYKNRNFMVCNIIMAGFAGCLFGLLTIEPILLERLFNYPIITTGLMLSPIGIGSAVGMIGVNFIMNRIDVRIIVITGLLGCALGCYMLSRISPNTDLTYFLWPNSILGLSMGLIMMPIAAYSLLTLEKKDITEGAGLFTYSRMIGTSIGIAMISTTLSHNTQVFWHQMGAHINRYSTNINNWLQQQHITMSNPKALIKLQHILAFQSSLEAFIFVFFILSITFCLLTVIATFLQPVNMTNVSSIPMH